MEVKVQGMVKWVERREETWPWAVGGVVSGVMCVWRKGRGGWKGLTGITMVDNIESRHRSHRRGRLPSLTPLPFLLYIPLRRPPASPRHILHMHCIRSQLPIPQPAHLLAQALINPRHTQRSPQPPGDIRSVYIRQPQHHHVQPLALAQIPFRLELPLCQPVPGFQLLGFFARRPRGLVDLPGGEFDEDGDVAARAFAAQREGEGVRAEAVDGVVLGRAGFAAAVEDVVVLVGCGGACEDAPE